MQYFGVFPKPAKRSLHMITSAEKTGKIR